MTMTDPIADMLTRLRNANQAYHDSVSMPYSKLKRASPRSSSRRATSPPSTCKDPTRAVGKTLTITLKYGRNRERSHRRRPPRSASPASGSTPSSTGLPKVLGGLGVAIISTSQGLLTDRQANQKGVGGEVLAYVW